MRLATPLASGLLVGAALLAPPHARAQQGTWALTNARIETVTRGTIEKGTIVIRDGLIAAVGAGITPPADARVVDLAGYTVYPGLIDLTSAMGLPPAPQPSGGFGGFGGGAPQTGEGTTRFVGLEPSRSVAAEVKPSASDLRAAREAGVTAVLVAPTRGAFRGLSALLPTREDSATQLLVRSPVALHMGFQGAPGRYPATLLGVVAYQRQTLYDAQHRALVLDRYRANPRGMPRSTHDEELDALVPVVRGTLPAFFAASNENEIRRALAIGKELGVKVTVVGATEAFRALDALKGARAPVVSVDFPRPNMVTGWNYAGAQRGTPGDSAARTAAATKIIEGNAAALHRAGVRFALASGGLGANDFLANVRKAIAAGLPRAAALEALTIRPAEIAGAGDQLGSIETGKIANLVVARGEPLADSTRTHMVFVDGIRYDVTTATSRTGNAQRGRDGGAQQGRNGNAQQQGAVPAQPAVAPFTFPVPAAGKLVAITNATIMTASSGTIERGTIVIRDGKIAAVGTNVAVPAGARVIDGAGKYVTPGIIDAHSHSMSEAINEGTNSITAEVRITDVLRQDPVSLYRQLAGGTTTLNILHGSANTIGGQNAVVKLRYGLPVDSLIFEGAPPGIKFALGENVRQTNRTLRPGQEPRYPRTRMGVEDLLRDAFTRAREYQAEWKAYEAASKAHRGKGDAPIPPKRDLQLDALVEILEGKRLVHCHSYRADEILMMLRVAKDFGFRVASFQHVLEGYKVADELAQAGSGASTFADYWGYKMEAWDAIPHNASLMAERGVLVSLNSDSDERARRLYQEAAKAMHYGGASEEEALRMITLNPAKQLGVDKRVGSIEVGKDADLAIFNAHPFAPAARVEMTLIDGRVFFDRATAPTLEHLMEQLHQRQAPRITSEAR